MLPFVETSVPLSLVCDLCRNPTTTHSRGKEPRSSGRIGRVGIRSGCNKRAERLNRTYAAARDSNLCALRHEPVHSPELFGKTTSPSDTNKLAYPGGSARSEPPHLRFDSAISTWPLAFRLRRDSAQKLMRLRSACLETSRADSACRRGQRVSAPREHEVEY